jgi:putative ABC transport system permease protein
MAESLVLAAGGTALGLALGFLGVEGLRSLGPTAHGVLQGDVESLTSLGLENIAVDGRILLFTVVVALATCVLFGLAPALKASRPDLVRDLKEGGGWRAGSRRIGNLGGRDLLVLAEVALAFVLLAGSGLMLKSLQRLGTVDLGFVSESTLTASLITSGYGASEREVFFAEVMEQVRAIPGVQAAGLSNCPPVSGGCSSTAITFFDRPQVEEGSEPSVDVHMVGPGFFETLNVPLIRGRTFDSGDRLGESRVVLLSEQAANEFWPGEDPVGRTVGLGQGPGFSEGAEVIGIVGDVHYRSVEALPGPTTYLPFSQAARRGGYLFVRVQGSPIAVASSVRRAVSSINPNVPVTDVRTMDERVAAAMVRTRFSASLLSLFAAVALTLSSVGVFGVLSYLVAQRTREIGIRMALGAQPGTVFWQVLRGVVVTTALGVALGGLASLGLMRVMGSLLFEVRPHDPTTLAIVALSLSVVSLAAAFLPARRATRVQPIEALRNR